MENDAKKSCDPRQALAKSARTRAFRGKQRCGCSSVVERDLAKVDVESSNLFTRSIFFKGLREIVSPYFFGWS